MNAPMHLPHLAYQKWNYVTVTFSGRKVDVMYNDNMVGSKMMDKILPYVSNPLIVGNESVNGTYMHGNIVGYKKTKAEVIKMRRRTSDTRGEPTLSLKDRIMGLSLGTQSVCLPGINCNKTVSASPGALNMWESPYA
jgi:hypothetical protein